MSAPGIDCFQPGDRVRTRGGSLKGTVEAWRTDREVPVLVVLWDEGTLARALYPDEVRNLRRVAR